MKVLDIDGLVGFIRERVKQRGDLPLAERRTAMDANVKAFPLPENVTVTQVEIEGAGHPLKAEWHIPPGCDSSRVLLYFHGGGYVQGSPRSHRHLTAAMAGKAGMAALSIDYRLAPEHPFPAAVDDAIAAYRWMLSHAYLPDRIAVGGDSAGGGLALALLLKARREGLALPRCVVLLSPWADLTCSGETYRTRADADPMITQNGILETARQYLGDADPCDPLASPVYADLSGLPPMLVQVGDAEVLLEDARTLAARGRKAGVSIDLEVWDRMVHVWQVYHPIFPEGARAVARIGEYLSSQLDSIRRSDAV